MNFRRRAKYFSKGYIACMNFSNLIFPCLPNTRFVHFLYSPSSPPPPSPTTTIRFLIVRLWTFLQMAFSTMLCSSQRSKKPLGKTPTHKVARNYLTKSVVLILMLNMQICSCPHVLKIWFLYVVWWAHEMSIKYKSSPRFTWVFP